MGERALGEEEKLYIKNWKIISIIFQLITWTTYESGNLDLFLRWMQGLILWDYSQFFLKCYSAFQCFFKCLVELLCILNHDLRNQSFLSLLQEFYGKKRKIEKRNGRMKISISIQFSRCQCNSCSVWNI